MSRITSDDTSVSLAPAALAHLSAAQQQRLAELLDRYLAALEDGTPLDPDELLTAHPDLAEPLRAYFRSLEDLHDMAAGIARPSVAATPPRELGSKRIGDFELLHEIGRGGMGVVYEAHQISLDRRVAVKLLPFTAVLDAKQIARFKNEAQAAAQLHHPNIVPVFAIGAERGVHYYAMQFIDGQPLDKAIEELRRVPWDRLPACHYSLNDRLEPYPTGQTPDEFETAIDAFAADTQAMRRSRAAASRCREIDTVLRLGIQAAEALHAAHEYGVVHRDVKPANLLLDARGKLWITDFGLARVADDRSLTRTGDIVGTRKYMSPEQASGNAARVDHRTDIYALGVTLYELLTLRTPGGEASATNSAGHAYLVAPPSPRQLRPDIPADLETVILKAMAKERDDRYATAQALADDLRCVLDGKPTVARPPTWREKLTRWSRGNQRLVVAAVSIAAVAVLGLTISVAMIAREQARAERNLASAEESFRDAHQAVDFFGARLAERLADMPGTSQLRRELLREAVKYYERLAARSATNPQLRADLATTYCQVAALADEVGSTEESLAAHQSARTLLERLAKEEPIQSRHAVRLTQCLNNLALSLRRGGRLDDARACLLEAIQLAKELPDARMELATAHGNLGLVTGDQQRFTEAEAAFRMAIRLLTELTGTEVAFRLATEEHNLATLLATRRPIGWVESDETHQELRPATPGFVKLDPLYSNSSTPLKEAEQLFTSALTRQTALARTIPNDARYSAAQASTLNSLAAVQLRRGYRDRALQSYDDAIRIQTKVVETAASQAAKQKYQHDLAISFSNRGLAFDQAGDWPAAEDSFRRSLALHETLLTLQPEATACRSSFGGVFNNLGSVLEHAGRLPEAAEAYAKAIGHQQQAIAQAPQVETYRTYLGKHLFNHGRVLRELGREEEAAGAANARRELFASRPGTKP